MGQIDVTAYLPLVKSVAMRMAARLPRNVDLDDLVGAGALGLLNAARQFDESRGVPFDRYAEIRIRGSIIDELRTMDQTSRTVRRQSTELGNLIDNLSHNLGRKPTSDETALALGVSLSQYQGMLAKNTPVHVIGFDDLGPKGDDGRAFSSAYLEDTSALPPDIEVGQKEAAAQLARLVDQLTARQRQVVTFYYFEGMNFKEIAGFLGVTEGRVSQLHTAAVGRLKTIMSGLAL
ncbi:MAG: FliA/WhiG family RNA polymerase sigma factor [Deltaproteobacteria bacterium]|nr:FliA/WhiG family RNA polymerase sigma factor [Deltaproteobacteria bacterium]